jgi:hypothetical protein
MINSYPKGSNVRLKANPFADADGTPADPTTVTLTVRDPAGVSTDYTYAAGDLTKSAAGIYYRDVMMAQSGTWLYRFVGTGACIAAGWRQINIESDPLG